ncbi:MAG: hypothetical protein RIT50_1290 [Bacteroidota bacterium]|jgi:hypothetical protein
MIKLMKSLLILAVVFLSLSSCTKDDVSQTPGPQTPACGFVQVLTNEVISGVQFPKGKYQINVFNITCGEVMGDMGLFSQFLQLGDNDPLPAPWIHLKDAVGAPKFVKSTSTNVGFRAQRVGD